MLDFIFRYLCRRFGHRWIAEETYAGEWWDICARCHAVRKHQPGRN